jgi:hypothetical protein
MQSRAAIVNEREGINVPNDEYLDQETRIKVYNWAFERGLTPMHYEWRHDTWLMSDGEPYTTTLIIREAGKIGY